MSVLIKGLDFPKEGRKTIQIDESGNVFIITDYEIKSSHYESKCQALNDGEFQIDLNKETLLQAEHDMISEYSGLNVSSNEKDTIETFYAITGINDFVGYLIEQMEQTIEGE